MKQIVSSGFRLLSKTDSLLVFTNSESNYIQITLKTKEIVNVSFFPNKNERNISNVLNLTSAVSGIYLFSETKTAQLHFLKTTSLICCCSISIPDGDFNIKWLQPNANIDSDLNLDQFIITEDLPYRNYSYSEENGSCNGVFHYLKRRPFAKTLDHIENDEFLEFHYGGERPSPLPLNNRRFKMEAGDALGYDPENADPLYKVTPFILSLLVNTRSNSTFSYGIHYDSLSKGFLDLGRETEAFTGFYRYFYTERPVLDYYFIAGGNGEDSVYNVLDSYTKLIGKPVFPPMYSFGYLASAMGYAEAENAQELLEKFPNECELNEIPCDLIHLSSGYTVDEENGARNVFTWNKKRFPVSANVKPWLLEIHPDYLSTSKTNAFFTDTETNLPSKTRLWSAGEGQSSTGSYFDFTSYAAQTYWTSGITSLLKLGIQSIWNDNNEYSILDDTAIVSISQTPPSLISNKQMSKENQKDPTTIGEIGRAIQPLLMAYLSYTAIQKSIPNERPFLITRSGTPGIQRFASQTWSGDNVTSWDTLKHNIPMGLNSGLALFPLGYGHDIGGFIGPRPSKELFVRWVQQGIFQGRFCIHSWKKEGVSTPWMYPDVLNIVRCAIKFRYKLVPFLYSLAFEGSRNGAPLMRAFVMEFPRDIRGYFRSFEYLLGRSLLVASVVEKGSVERNVYLPNSVAGDEYWYDWFGLGWYSGGQDVNVKVPLSQHGALFFRAGSLIPTGTGVIPNKNRPETLKDNKRVVWAFPTPSKSVVKRRFEFDLFEDDGVSVLGEDGVNWSKLKLWMDVVGDEISVGVEWLERGFDVGYEVVEFVFFGVGQGWVVTDGKRGGENGKQWKVIIPINL